MVNLLLSGVNAVELGNLSGESSRTLQSWLKSVDENGWSSLQAIKQTGRPCKLSEDQIASLKETVSNDPNLYCYNNWDGPSLSDFISTTYSIKYGVRACQKLLHKMDFNLVRPHTFPTLGKEDSLARADFKKTKRNHERVKQGTCISR